MTPPCTTSARRQQGPKDPGLQSQALRTLARFRDPALVKRTLDYTVSGEVRNQDSWVLLVLCSDSVRPAIRRGSTSRTTGTKFMPS